MTSLPVTRFPLAADVPLLGLPSGNPPAGVAILYVLLDLIVVWLVTRLQQRATAAYVPA